MRKRLGQRQHESEVEQRKALVSAFQILDTRRTGALAVPTVEDLLRALRAEMSCGGDFSGPRSPVADWLAAPDMASLAPKFGEESSDGG